MKKQLLAIALMSITLVGCTTKENNQNDNDMNTTLTLTQEWDKVFPQSDKVDHKKVTFKNRYGIELAAARAVANLVVQPVLISTLRTSSPLLTSFPYKTMLTLIR